jgi:hypothetical protein
MNAMHASIFFKCPLWFAIFIPKAHQWLENGHSSFGHVTMNCKCVWNFWKLSKEVDMDCSFSMSHCMYFLNPWFKNYEVSKFLAHLRRSN